MGLIERFWTWLTTSSSGRSKKGHPDLYPLDVPKLTRELKLIEEAKRLGQAGLPAPETKTHSGPEAAIIQRVEKARQDYVDWAVLRLNLLSEQLGKRNVTQRINRARQADKEFERKAGALLTEQDNLLRGLGDTAKRRQSELESFQSKHELTKDAHFPTPTGAYFRYALLLLLIVVEGVFNAGFFSQGLATGWLGGLTQAGMLAATNVIIAFVLGKFAVRYVNHVGFGWKLLGVLSIILAAAVMVSMGLVIAHYRDSLISEASDAAKAALESLKAHPFELRDTFSWALFGISVAFGIASLFDGLFSDDLYPGYGPVSRRTQLAIEDYEDELNTLNSNLNELKDEELTALERIVLESQAAIAAFESLIKDKTAAGSRLSNALRDADNSMSALLSKFRTENEIHRGDVRRPPYFDSQPQLRVLETPDFSTSSDTSTLAEQRSLVMALLDEEQDIRARIQAAFTREFTRLKALDTHFPRKAVA